MGKTKLNTKNQDLETKAKSPSVNFDREARYVLQDIAHGGINSVDKSVLEYGLKNKIYGQVEIDKAQERFEERPDSHL